MPFLWHVCSSKTRPVLPNWLPGPESPREQGERGQDTKGDVTFHRGLAPRAGRRAACDMLRTVLSACLLFQAYLGAGAGAGARAGRAACQPLTSSPTQAKSKAAPRDRTRRDPGVTHSPHRLGHLLCAGHCARFWGYNGGRE